MINCISPKDDQCRELKKWKKWKKQLTTEAWIDQIWTRIESSVISPSTENQPPKWVLFDQPAKTGAEEEETAKQAISVVMMCNDWFAAILVIRI